MGGVGGLDKTGRGKSGQSVGGRHEERNSFDMKSLGSAHLAHFLMNLKVGTQTCGCGATNGLDV